MEPMCETPRAVKLYIATKMRGLTRSEIQAKLDKIAYQCGYYDNYELINFLSEEESADKAPVECLTLSIANLNKADVVIIEKYEETRGVSCEEYICNKYKIPYHKVFLKD